MTKQIDQPHYRPFIKGNAAIGSYHGLVEGRERLVNRIYSLILSSLIRLLPIPETDSSRVIYFPYRPEEIE